MIVSEKHATSSANIRAITSSMSFEIDMPLSDSDLKYDIKSLINREKIIGELKQPWHVPILHSKNCEIDFFTLTQDLSGIQ